MSKQTATKPIGTQGRILRRFRIAVYGAYFAFILVFVALIIQGVVGSVRHMTPPRRPPAVAPAALPECVVRAETMWKELEQERIEITSHPNAQQVDLLWVGFRKEWLLRFRDVESDCAVHGPDRPQLKRLFRRLETVLDLYTTHAVQYSGEIGGAVDALRAEFKNVK